MTVAQELHCAACGRPIEGKGLEVKVWEGEDAAALVCSRVCRKSYRAGQVASDLAPDLTGRIDRLVILVLGLAVASEGTRALLDAFMSDPLSMVVPLPIRLLSAVLLLVLAVSLARGRRAAAKAALAVALLTAMADISFAIASGNLLPLLVPASLTLPLFLLMLGTPSVKRQAAAIVFASLLPAFLLWDGTVQALERQRSLERIAQVTLTGDVASSGPGGLALELPDSWRALQPDNGIVDWPHSEFELIQPSTGAVAFAALNPDCDREALGDFQQRSLDALAEAGGDPVPFGLSRIGDGTMELRVHLRRGRARLTSFNLFRELPSDSGGGGRPGCVWLHCLGPPRVESEVRSQCREMIGQLRRVERESSSQYRPAMSRLRDPSDGGSLNERGWLG